jgi:hypothetical protein
MVITTNPLVKCDMISVTLTAGSNQTKIPFPDQPQLRGVFLQSIDFPYISVDYYNQPTTNQISGYVSTSFLTLYFEGKENVQQMPLAELVSNTQSALSYNMNGSLGFYNQQIIWPKCYITLSSSLPPLADLVYTFAVYYSLNKI